MVQQPSPIGETVYGLGSELTSNSISTTAERSESERDGGGGDGESGEARRERRRRRGGLQDEGGHGLEPLVPESEAMAPALVPQPAPQMDRRADDCESLTPPRGGRARVRSGAGVLSPDCSIQQERQGEGNDRYNVKLQKHNHLR